MLMSRIQEITDAVRRLSLSADRFNIIPEPLASSILTSIEERFVEHVGKRWWWEDFRERPSAKVHFPNGSGWRRLKDIAPDDCGSMWFVVEDDVHFILCESEIEAIMSVIGECSPFEYYIVSKNLDWLVCENHSDMIYAVGEAVLDRLSLIASIGSDRLPVSEYHSRH